MEPNLGNLETSLKLKFKNKDILKNAFIHRSYLNEHPEVSIPHNERLEFLGDAVLGLIVSEHLFNKYPNHPEGDLTNFRSSLVNARILSKVAKDLGLGEFLFLSRGEESTGGRQRQYILANTYEALLGAIHLDQGLTESSRFVDKTLLPNLQEIIKKKLYKDYKSLLQELLQAKFNVTPSYKLISERGPDHSKIFEIGVYMKEKLLAAGSGT